MAEPQPPKNLLEKTLELADQRAELDRRLREEEQRPPEPGDVYVFAETRDHPVEWVLVSRDPARPERLLAIPADGHFLVGSGDLALRETSWIGDRRLRCRFGVWLDAAATAARERVGILDEREVEPARRKWTAAERGELTGSALEREADADPEYREWVEDVLAPACRALCESELSAPGLPEDAPGAPDGPARPNAEPARVRPGPWRRVRRQVTPMAAALAAVAVGLSGWVWQLRDRDEEPLVLRSLRSPELTFREFVRPEEILVVERVARHGSLFLMLPDVPPLPASYRVRLRERNSQEVIWQSDELRAEMEFMLVLPRSIAPGDYLLVLEGYDARGVRVLSQTRNFRLEDRR